MFAQITAQNRAFYGIAYPGYLPGGTSEDVLDLLTRVVPELDCYTEEYPNSHIHLFNFSKQDRSPIFKDVEVLMRVEKEPSISFPTKRTLGIKHKYVPHHEFELLAYSESNPVLIKAIGDFLVRKPDLKIKSKKFKDENTENTAKLALSKRLFSFCQEISSSNEVLPEKIYRSAPYQFPGFLFVPRNKD